MVEFVFFIFFIYKIVYKLWDVRRNKEMVLGNCWFVRAVLSHNLCFAASKFGLKHDKFTDMYI